MIEFKCQACGKFLKLPHSYAGKTTECPGCRQTVHVPGAAPEKPPSHAPRSTRPAMQLCVDCGGGFPSGQMLEHTGQLVCTDCYHKRKPVVLKPRKKRKPICKRKLLLYLLIAAAVTAAAWALWHFVF